MSNSNEYPDNNPKTVYGLKKVALALNPFPALIHMARAFMDGARKYGPYNWRKKKVSSTVYIHAAQRHIAQWFDGEEQDPVSKVHHLGHAMACLAIILDAQAVGNLNDDRPPAANTGDLLRALTEEEPKP